MQAVPCFGDSSWGSAGMCCDVLGWDVLRWDEQSSGLAGVGAGEDEADGILAKKIIQAANHYFH